MTTTIPWIFWLFPVVFTIHNIEEAVWLPEFSKRAGRFCRPVARLEFVFAVACITALAAVITALFYLKGPESIPSYLFFAFNFVMLINVFVPHLAATIALRRYCPGLATGVLLLVPVTAGNLLVGYNRGYYHPALFGIIAILFAGIVVGAIPVLFRIGRWVQRMGWR